MAPLSPVRRYFAGVLHLHKLTSMKKIILSYGFLSGALAALYMVLMGFIMRRSMDFSSMGMVYGYAAILLTLLLVFFGIRAYRDREGGGYITFGRAFQVGMGIALISCVCYVLAWMVVWTTLVPDFADRYSETIVRQAEQRGANPTEIEHVSQQAAQMRVWYDNPWMVAALTFLEPFPVALLVTMISALVLRRKPQVAVEA
jgi:hypothetical protein